MSGLLQIVQAIKDALKVMECQVAGICVDAFAACRIMVPLEAKIPKKNCVFLVLHTVLS